MGLYSGSDAEYHKGYYGDTRRLVYGSYGDVGSIAQCIALLILLCLSVENEGLKRNMGMAKFLGIWLQGIIGDNIGNRCYIGIHSSMVSRQPTRAFL